MDKLLDELVGKLTKTYGDLLVSVVLYGSAAVGDHSGRFSDINVFCVLREINPRVLGASEPILRWWRDKDNPTPLLMSLDEVRTSTDCFPIEFHDIRERHRILYGENVVEDLEIDESFYRARVEYELRAKLLRLRQKSAGVLHDPNLLLRLMAESVSTFCVLTRHALRLHGEDAPFPKREIAEQARAAFGIDPAPFLALLDLRDGRRKPKELDAEALLGQYLREISGVIDVVDRLEK